MLWHAPHQATERASRPRTAVFAINQDYGRAMVELDDGKTLARVVEMSAATLALVCSPSCSSPSTAKMARAVLWSTA